MRWLPPLRMILIVALLSIYACVRESVTPATRNVNTKKALTRTGFISHESNADIGHSKLPGNGRDISCRALPHLASLELPQSMDERLGSDALDSLSSGNYSRARKLLQIAISKTDRGYIYLLYGKPNLIERNPMNPFLEKALDQGSSYPFERWTYKNPDGSNDNIELEFVDKEFNSRYAVILYPEEYPLELQPLVNRKATCSDADAAPAFWLIGFTYYLEGGQENLQKAAAYYSDFLELFTKYPEDLIQHAHINLAAINLELARSAKSGEARMKASQEAYTAMSAALIKWPETTWNFNVVSFPSQAILNGLNAIIFDDPPANAPVLERTSSRER